MTDIDLATIEARHQPVLRRDIVTDREWPFYSCGTRDCDTRQVLVAFRAAEARLREALEDFAAAEPNEQRRAKIRAAVAEPEAVRWCEEPDCLAEPHRLVVQSHEWPVDER